MTDIPATSLPPRRRTVVRAAAAGLAGAALLTGRPATARAAGDRPPRAAFHHGVASGDPLPDGVLLWTRITPEPGAVPGAGLGEPVAVDWQVSRDPHFRRVVATGRAVATARSDHTVKADVRGLHPATDYWYRFSCGGVRSEPGRTRTAPRPGAAVPGIRFGVVSCANWESGWFSAYRHLARRRDIDAVLHLGDYLYEYATYAGRGTVARPNHPPHECLTLADYRARHGSYKTDPDLRALHAARPFIAIWDDHEFADDAWAGGAANHDPRTEGRWEDRVAAAKRAYFEWMPVRTATGGTTYRTLAFGDLATLFLLDLRSFRSGTGDPAGGQAPGPTITGRAQMDWLKTGLAADRAVWRLVGNPVMMAPVVLPDLPAPGLREALPHAAPAHRPLNPEAWDGYAGDRRELLSHLARAGVADTVFLTGDVHCAWAAEVPAAAAGPGHDGRPLAAEFVVTSVTSDNYGDQLGSSAPAQLPAVEAAVRAANPHVRWVDLASHGYSVLDVTRDAVQMDYHAVTDRMTPASPSSWRAAYRVARGASRVEAASPLR
ncbi:alkaline phosphatase D family protein [Streptomyces sp. NPDC127106]|uniref:alkaline phosphatase D family protein n=1 Tax=Streptomyces sp. NPDC127106 TaxID=3345360 RepID=UPI003633C7DE